MRVFFAGVVLALVACNERGGSDLERMLAQRKALPYAANPYASGGVVLERPPAGTLAREASSARPKLSRELLRRGQNRFDRFCAPCHGLLGDGDSEVARSASFRPPPSLHEPRIVAMPNERLFDVITGGYGLMPSFGAPLAPADRWAVVRYVRALERSQHVELGTLSPEERKRF